MPVIVDEQKANDAITHVEELFQRANESALSANAIVEDQAIKALHQIRGNIDSWKTTFLDWARSGHRNDGTVYGFDKWLQFGRDVSQVLNEQIKGTDRFDWTTQITEPLTDTAKDVVSGVKEAAKISLPVIGLVAIAAIVLGVVYLARKVS